MIGLRPFGPGSFLVVFDAGFGLQRCTCAVVDGLLTNVNQVRWSDGEMAAPGDIHFPLSMGVPL